MTRIKSVLKKEAGGNLPDRDQLVVRALHHPMNRFPSPDHLFYVNIYSMNSYS